MRARAATWSLIIIAAIYAAFVISHWNLGYIDFGDGNYMYISWRIAEGATPYSDILIPQPPMHLMVGAVLAKLGALVPAPVYIFRAFSLLLHIATMIVIYFAARATALASPASDGPRARAVGVAAAAIYMLLPLGFWWSLGYQSEPLEMFFFMISYVCFLRWTRGGMVAAGIFGALMPLTNMTAAPYVLFNIGYLAVRRPRLLLAYALPVVVVIATVTAGMELWTDAYLENVIFNQVGSFPRPELLPPGQTLWTYAVGKIINEGQDVLRLEGVPIFLALAGIVAFVANGTSPAREYASWYAFFAMCSIIYVSKGGTMDYIFTIGEPFVAVFSGWLVVVVWQKYCSGYLRGFSWRDTAPAAAVLALVVALLAAWFPGLRHSWATLKQQTYELPQHETLQVVRQITRYAKPHDVILAPPYYAYVAQRRIALDYSELLLWTLKFANEQVDKQRGRATETTEKLAEMIRNKQIAFIALDMGQTARIPEIKTAIDESYRPVSATDLRTLNTTIRYYVPK